MCLVDEILWSGGIYSTGKGNSRWGHLYPSFNCAPSLSSPFMVNPSAYKSVTATAQILEAHSQERHMTQVERNTVQATQFG